MEKFSVYPAGAQGGALSALRASLACSLLAHALSSTPPFPLKIVMYAVAVALLAGGFARIAAIADIPIAVVAFDHLDFVTLAHCLDALAVGILGPGAYSLDARWFGRRIIRIDRLQPPRLRNPDG